MLILPLWFPTWDLTRLRVVDSCSESTRMERLDLLTPQRLFHTLIFQAKPPGRIMRLKFARFKFQMGQSLLSSCLVSLFMWLRWAWLLTTWFFRQPMNPWPLFCSIPGPPFLIETPLTCSVGKRTMTIQEVFPIPTKRWPIQWDTDLSLATVKTCMCFLTRQLTCTKGFKSSDSQPTWV